MRRINIGVVGYGKIAHDQHLPALGANPRYRLSAITAGAHAPPPGTAVFGSLDDMLANSRDLEAVALCTPPQGRHVLARRALDHGLHVMLEKPPGQTSSEVEELIATAVARSLALFAAWHSREAPAVEAARLWLADTVLLDVVVSWKEDVRRWHPNQAWIWEPGGFGVLDPGINALSIVTRVLPRTIFLTHADFYMPENRAMPIAAALTFADSAGTPIRADFDWRQTGEQLWEVVVNTNRGCLRISDGGAALSIDGRAVTLGAEREYPNLYDRFAALIEGRAVDVDLAPLRLVADAFTIGRRHPVPAFVD